MPQTLYFYPSQIFGVELKFKQIVLSESEFKFVVILCVFLFTKIAFVPPLLLADPGEARGCSINSLVFN